jgi:hypothetical protein
VVGFPMPPPFLAGTAAGAALVLIKKLRTGSFSTARRFANSIRYCAQGEVIGKLGREGGERYLRVQANRRRLCIHR